MSKRSVQFELELFLSLDGISWSERALVEVTRAPTGGVRVTSLPSEGFRGPEAMDTFEADASTASLRRAAEYLATQATVGRDPEMRVRFGDFAAVV